MRILLVNKYNFLKGGADKYFLELAEGLEKHGAITAKFCMRHPDNLPDEHEKYFVSESDYEKPGLIGQILNSARIIWNREAARKFEALVEDFKPDIIHLQNIYHQISPSILAVARRRKIPVVMHLNDYKLICPNYKLLRQGKVCDACRGGKYCQAVRYRCLKGSRLKSAVAAVEMHIHHNLLDIYAKNVSRFIAPSRFMADTVSQWRPDITSIAVLPYFIRSEGYDPGEGPGRDFIFVGRLSEEKGIGTMIGAWKQAVDARADGCKLNIVGEGVEREKAAKLVRDPGLQDSVSFAGAVFGPELLTMIGRSRAMIVPSEWNEVLGIVNLEASLMSRPVIASDIGGIPEVVQDGKTGLLFPAGNAETLTEKIDLLARDESLATDLGRAGRKFVLDNFNEDEHINALMGIYREVINLCR